MSRLTDEELTMLSLHAGQLRYAADVPVRVQNFVDMYVAEQLASAVAELRARRSADRDLATVLVDHRLLSPDVKLEDAVALIRQCGLSPEEAEALRHIAGQLRRHELRTPTEDRALAALDKLLGER